MNRHRVVRWLAIAAIAFGALTLFSGGQALFGGPQARAAVGTAVPFVLWFNFCAGFVYILAGAGLLRRSRWAVYASIFLALSTALVTAAFGVYVLTGGAFETRTIGALAIRLLFWIVVAVAAMSPTKVPSKHQSIARR
jgi:hypothetical protein